MQHGVLSPSVALANRVRRLRASGADIINFGTRPDVPTHVREAAIAFLDSGDSSAYTDARGLPELRHAIAAKIARENALGVDADAEVVVTAGGKQAVYAAVMALADRGDEVLVEDPGWVSFTGVDPGRLLLGMLGAPWNAMAPTRPAVRAVKARIIQVQEHERGTRLGIGYGNPIVSDRALRTAVIPIGFSDGLNHAPPLGDVLVCGRRAPVLGRRSIEFSLLDVSDIPEADVGTEAVVLGRQGDEEITAEEISQTVGVPMIELVARLAHNTRRVYL